MDALFDIKTLIAGNAALATFIALLLLLFKLNHRTYPGYGRWMAGALLVAAAYVLICFNTLLPPWYIILVHGFIALATVFRFDGVSSLAENRRIAKIHYWLPAFYTLVITYFTFFSASAFARNFSLGIFALTYTILASMKLFNNLSEKNKALYKTTGLLLLTYGVAILARSLTWLIKPEAGAGVLTFGKLQQIYFFLVMLFELGLGVSILMINSQRLEVDLLASRDNLQETVDKLQAAKNEVKEISGLLPICASCKKIRDDQGYWSQLEEYFQDHSEVLFSHGMCPGCMKKFFPDEHAAAVTEKKP